MRVITCGANDCTSVFLWDDGEERHGMGMYREVRFAGNSRIDEEEC